jgi:hypothetical protein
MKSYTSVTRALAYCRARKNLNAASSQGLIVTSQKPTRRTKIFNMSKPTDMSFTEEHFLTVPLVFQFNHFGDTFSDFFLKNIPVRKFSIGRQHKHSAYIIYNICARWPSRTWSIRAILGRQQTMFRRIDEIANIIGSFTMSMHMTN